MNFLKYLNIIIVRSIKPITLIVLLTTFNIANAIPVTVKVEDMDLYSWASIEDELPGFGSSGPVTLNWNPDNKFATRLIVQNSWYSGRAAATCWYQADCTMELSVSSENTEVTLESFFLSTYHINGKNVPYSIIDLETGTAVLTDVPWVSYTNGSIINVNASSNVGFRFLFGSPRIYGGINDITYSYNDADLVPTPIPTAVWLFGSGLIGLKRFTRTNT